MTENVIIIIILTGFFSLCLWAYIKCKQYDDLEIDFDELPSFVCDRCGMLSGGEVCIWDVSTVCQCCYDSLSGGGLFSFPQIEAARIMRECDEIQELEAKLNNLSIKSDNLLADIENARRGLYE